MVALSVMMSCCVAFAADVPANSVAVQEDEVGPMSVTQWSFYFSPIEVSLNEYTYAEGEGWTTYYIPDPVPIKPNVDARFEMLIDHWCSQPSIVSRTNLPYKSITLQNRDEFGGDCWVYDSGVVWYNQNTYYALKMKAKSDEYGVHKGMWGSSYLIPDHWETDYFTVTSN
mgnify:FL=1